MKNKDRYIIRKYVYATSAIGAIKLDKKCPVHDVWIDNDYKKEDTELASAIGFNVENNKEEDED